jgi:type IV secretion system protein VirB1
MVAVLPSFAACPPGILSTTTVQAIIANESGGNPLAIRVNGANLALPAPRDADDATALATRLVAAGYSVDLGLMQVNSANLPWLHESVRDMFSLCANIAAGSLIFTEDYDLALRAMKFGTDALDAALSAYNTGNFVDGIVNGYVAHYDVSGGIDAIQARAAGVSAPVMGLGMALGGTDVQLVGLGRFWLDAGMRGAGPRSAVPLRAADFRYTQKGLSGPIHLTGMTIFQATPSPIGRSAGIHSRRSAARSAAPRIPLKRSDYRND